MKREMIEGPEATANFECGMKRLFQVPKSEVLKAERKFKAKQRRKRKKQSKPVSIH
jgi:hypothetical protein